MTNTTSQLVLGRIVGLCALLILLNESAMTGEIMLESPLNVRIGQEGFSGRTGTNYKIDRNGAWQLQGFINEIDEDPKSSGQLTGSELEALKTMLSRDDMASSDDEAPVVNPSFVEVSYGGQSWTIMLPAGTDLAAGCEGKTHCAVAELGAFLQKVLGVVY